MADFYQKSAMLRALPEDFQPLPLQTKKEICIFYDSDCTKTIARLENHSADRL